MNLPLIRQTSNFTVREIPANGLARSFERRRLRAYLAQCIADVVVILAAYLMAEVVYLGSHFVLRNGVARALLPAELLLPIYLTLALYNGTYSLQSLRNWKTGASRAATALAISAALFNFIIFFVRLDANYSRITFVLALALAALVMGATRRLSLDLMRRRWGPSPLNVLVIDDGGPPIDLRHAYHLDAAERGLRPAVDDPHLLDSLARYVCNMDQVLVSCAPERRLAWAMVLKGCGVSGEVLSDYMREIGALGLVHRDEIGMT